MIEKKIVINLAVSREARQRLESLAKAAEHSLGTTLERAIMAYQLAAIQPDRTAALESRIEALESAFKALTVEAAPVYQADTKPAEMALEAAVEPLPEPGMLEAANPVISEMKEEPGRMEKEAGPIPSIPPHKPLTVKGLIDEMVAGGERSPTRIANALNDAGFRTQTKTRFERSNPQIKKALDGVRGK